jgi:hypothetical protein
MLFNYGRLLRLWQSKFKEGKILAFVSSYAIWYTGWTDGWMYVWMDGWMDG